MLLDYRRTIVNLVYRHSYSFFISWI